MIEKRRATIISFLVLSSIISSAIMIYKKELAETVKQNCERG